MLREKLKSRLLKPLLLLAALLAISQTTWAADFSAYGLRGGWDSTWGTTRNFSADGKLTMTYDNYEFKLYNGSYIEFSGEKQGMTYDASVMEVSNNNLKLKGCPSNTEVEFTLTEVNGKPHLSASWTTFEPEPGTYIYGYFDDGTPAKICDISSKGSYEIPAAASERKLYYVLYDNKTRYGHSGGNFTQKIENAAGSDNGWKDCVMLSEVSSTSNDYFVVTIPANNKITLHYENGFGFNNNNTNGYTSGSGRGVWFTNLTPTTVGSTIYNVRLLSGNGNQAGSQDCEGGKSVTLSTIMNTGDEFYFNIYEGSSWKANVMPGSNTDVTNGSSFTSGFDGGAKYVWKGGNGTVTATVTLDTNGAVSSISFTGPENGGGEIVNPAYTYYLRGDWASNDAGWGTDDQRAFAMEDGKLVYTFLGMDLQSQFRVWYNDGSEHWTSPTGTNVMFVGSGSENLKINTLRKGTADITFTLTLNADGTPRTLDVTWTNEHLDESYVVPGMPFYPYGVKSESQFQTAINEGKPYYYLLGHALNNEQPSPEWELVPGEKLFPGDARYADKYVCDFTFTKHLDSADPDGYGVSTGSTRKVFVSKFANAAAETTEVAYAGRDIWNEIEKPKDAINNSLRLRAVYDPTLSGAACLKFEYLHLNEGGVWEVSAVPDALPFISLVGEKWKQIDGVPTAVKNIPASKLGTDYDGWTTTTNGWQQSWIQYNADGEAVTSRDKTGVYFNTQWPPVNDIMFTSQFKLNGKDYEMGLNSGELTFTTTGVQAKGAQWKQDPRFVNSENLDLDDNAEYRLYEVSDLWGNGKFKLWTGWSGARKNKNSDGAEWEYNWNWGHGSQSTSETLIETNTTVKLGLKDGDMVFNKPTYLSHVYFFLDVKNPRVQNACRLYTTLAPGGAQIHALSNSDYSAGVFKPELTQIQDENTKVTGVRVVIYRSSDNRTIGEIMVEDNLSVAASDFSTIFAKDFASADDYAQGYFHDGFKYQNSGWYYYTMEVSFDNTTEKALVKSNPYYVQAVASTLFVGQLIKVKENAPEELKKYDYVTYSPGMTEAYGYNKTKAEEMGEWGYYVTKLDKVPEPSFYASSDQALWTNKMLLYARRPWMGPNADESMIGSTGIRWTLQLPDAMDTPTSIQTTHEEIIKEDAPLEYVFNAPDVFRHTYSVTLTYLPKETGSEGGQRDEITTQPMTYYVAPRVPTPRMKPGKFDAIITYDEDSKDVTVSGALHTGLTTDEYTASDIEYKKTRVRRLHIKTYVDMPNATEDLIRLIPNDEDYSGTPANEHQLGKATRETAFEGDARLLEYLKGTYLNLKDVTPESHIYFVNQDINRWIQLNEATGEYEAIPRKLVFDFKKNKGLVIFYERRAEGVTIEIKPELQAPKLAEGDPHVYRVIRETAPGANNYEELLILANTTEITPAVSKLADTELTIDATSHDPYYAFRINGQAVGINGCDDQTETNALQHHSALSKDETTCYVIERKELGTYWGGMGETSMLSNSFDLEVAHGYIFATSAEGFDMEYYGAIYKPGQEEIDPTPAAAPMRAAAAGKAEQHMVFVSVPAKAEYNLTDIQTSIEDVEMNGAGIVAGAGFIDMMGNEGAVYSVDGRVLYQGAGRVELPAGIYVAATASETMKVIVK